MGTILYPFDTPRYLEWVSHPAGRLTIIAKDMLRRIPTTAGYSDICLSGCVGCIRINSEN